MIVSRTISLLPVLAIFVLFPFFEGGKTSTGLFCFHSITLFGLAAAALFYSRIWVSRFLIYFFPFLILLVISTVFSPYKYAAFLKLWDFIAAASWATLLSTLIQEEKESFESYSVHIFVAGAISTIVAILIHYPTDPGRVSASFLNPNEYGTFGLMLLCFGIFCFEHAISRRRKILVATLLSLLLLSVALTFSRGIFVASLSVAIVAFFHQKPGKTVKTFLISLLVISGILVALRFRYQDDPLKYYRWKIWKSSLKGVAADPYFGIGLGMLEYRARIYNFPTDAEVGRYGRIARSADSQYVEILAETGFLGLVSFLFGWFSLYFSLRKISARFFYPGLAWLIITLTCLFSVPLENTSVIYLLMFLLVFCLSENKNEFKLISFERPGRILIPLGCFLVYVFGVFLPFQADREFYRALKSSTPQETDKHLASAVQYNPYQPYYKFVFIRKIVDSRPNLDTHKWLNLLKLIEEAIQLNPLEYEFYLYRARIYRVLLEKDLNLGFYSGVVSSYQTALDWNPHNVFLRLEYASFLYRFNRQGLAEIELRKTLEREPAFLNARLFLAEVLLSRNSSEEARKEYLAFLNYNKRFRNEAANTSSSYIRSLLEVNEQKKKRVEDLLKAG
ncbi:O-antigen ligase family protein [bacterium]|nr:O-antigen ligase family protein [bacterium]